MTKNELKHLRELFMQQTGYIRQCTSESHIFETEEMQQQRIAHLSKPENYGEFFDYYFGAGTPLAMGDAPCADFHINSAIELFENPIIDQFRIWFRSAAKSIQTNVGNTFWLKEIDKTKFILLIGKNQDRANLLLADIQAQLEGNQRIARDFGKQVKHGDWANGNFTTNDGCYFLALGINQPFRGLRNMAHRVELAIVDDIEDRKIAQNDRLVREYTEKITGDLGGAFDKKRQRLVVCNNLITKTGIVNRLLEKKKDSPYTKLQQINYINENGKPAWKERDSLIDVAITQKKHDHFTFQREFMNNPIEEGKLFTEKQVNNYIEPLLYEQYQGFVGHWDLSYVTEGDYKAYVLLAITDAELHIVDVFCRKCTTATAIKWHFDKMKSLNIAVLNFYDATAAQEEVFGTAFSQEARRQKYYELPLPNRSQRTDKHSRIETVLASAYHYKKIKVSIKLKDSKDWQSAQNQLLAFEKGSKQHDDFPDTLTEAVRLASEHYDFEGEAEYLNQFFKNTTIKNYTRVY